ncbi:MAG TPA: polyprenyl synthetase family protein [Chthoniobacteraceae bacterium]|nr:polyprenyl synthetase family protein [Chthoniobacteraceae bacterium]
MKISANSAATTNGVAGPLSRVFAPVQKQLDEVDRRITAQTAAFDPALEGYVAYAVGGGGKRLRPLVALLSGGATGTLASGHLDLAVIVELIHLATLVHDDIMDEAERRRAQPTVNARWGNSLSVLLGDVLFAHALNLSTDFDDTNISRTIARTATEVCSGEMIQTQRLFDLQLSREEYFRIIGMKTGSLFACAAELGAVISGAPDEVVRRMKNYGAKIGTAYQIYDDCLDIAGTEAETGKTLGTDLRKGKLTLPVLTLLESASAFDRERCCALVLEGKLAEVTALLQNAPAQGALGASVNAASELIRSAQAELAPLTATRCLDALFGLGEALQELLEQVRS